LSIGANCDSIDDVSLKSQRDEFLNGLVAQFTHAGPQTAQSADTASDVTTRDKGVVAHPVSAQRALLN
jgi:hypothetical protein